MTLRRLGTIAAWVGVAGIVILSVLPGQDRPSTGFSGHEEHFVAYALTGLAFSIVADRTVARVLAAIALALLSAAMELAQLYVPGRHSAVSDAVVSSLGAAAGIAVGLTMAILARRIPKSYLAFFDHT